jgi:hypothetical protein
MFVPLVLVGIELIREYKKILVEQSNEGKKFGKFGMD